VQHYPRQCYLQAAEDKEMPKTKRDLLKRQVAMGYLNLAKAGNHIMQVEETFQDAHPELAASLLTACEGILMVQNILEKFVKDAWGMENTIWTAWENEPDKRKVDNGAG
jgi:hypothetical protein